MARPVWTAQCTAGRLVRELLPVRRRESHKGDYGRVLLLCGSEGLTGAARLAAKGALRTGSGLVYLGVPEKIYPIIAAGAGSEIVFPLPCDEEGRLCMASLPAITARLENMDAVLLGPGLGRSEELTRLVQAVLLRCRAPLVLDADGINAVAGHIDVLRGCACPVVLTPHDGEFLRLGGDPKADDRTRETMRLASRSHAVVLLKGSRTVITEYLCQPHRQPRPCHRRQRRRTGRHDRFAARPAYHAAGGGSRRGMAARRCGRPCGPGAGGIRHGAGGSAFAHSATFTVRVILLRKKFALLLTLISIFLTGCAAKSPAQQPLTFRTALLEAGGCSFTAAVTADYGETTTDFTLDASFAPDTGASLTVTAPETIAGITAHVKDSTADVSFDNTQLGLGSLANGRLAPLAAPYVLGQSWAGAYIDSTGTEDGLLRATYRLGYDKQELVVDTWFTEEPFTPQYAEISADGRMVLSIRISNFAMQ